MHVGFLNRVFRISLFVILIIASCAKINTPSGGPRDKLPPVVVKSQPEPGAKNFKGNKVVITFNEYVVLDNINDKFIMSPPMKKKPRIAVKGKSVVVEFQEKLKDSTTYSLNFQDAIKDLNEGNIFPNYKFVMSTGQVIDTLSVTGNAYNAANLEVPEKTSVLLYRNLSDSAVIKHFPDYISAVDPTGYFRIDNVRDGTYKLYSLKESDNSLTYNNSEEGFAFLDSNIVVTPERNYIPPVIIKDTTALQQQKQLKNSKNKEVTGKKEAGNKKDLNKKTKQAKDSANLKKEVMVLSGEHRLFQFTSSRKSHYLVTSDRENMYLLKYILSLPPDTMSVDFSILDEESHNYLQEPSKNRDTLKVWLVDSALYRKTSLKTLLKYPFTDTLGVTGYRLDTLTMRFMPPREAKKGKTKKKGLPVENNIQAGYLKPGANIVFTSTTPLKMADTSLIRLYETDETKKINIPVPYIILRDSTSNKKYIFKARISQEKKYFFLANKGSFRDIYDNGSDSTGIKFTVKDPESYCKLSLDIRNHNGPRIIQILDKSERLVAEASMQKDGKIIFPLLESGVYRMRVIYDLNGDGKWTTGDYMKHIQPEPVSYFPSEIDLKPGWQLDQVWDINVMNIKDKKLVTYNLDKKKGK